MEELQWEDPPTNGWEYRRVAMVEQLKKRPGVWARVTDRTYSTRSTAAVHRRAFPGTEWVTRKRGDGRFDLYGRWVGDDGEEV